MQDEKFVVHLGEMIRQKRDEKGFTLQQLADMMQIEKSNLIRLEKGRTNPTIKTLKSVADSLNIPLKELFDF